MGVCSSGTTIMSDGRRRYRECSAGHRTSSDDREILLVIDARFGV